MVAAELLNYCSTVSSHCEMLAKFSVLGAGNRSHSPDSYEACWNLAIEARAG